MPIAFFVTTLGDTNLANIKQFLLGKSSAPITLSGLGLEKSADEAMADLLLSREL